MKCPKCGSELRKGSLKIRNVNKTADVKITWQSEEEFGKLFKNDTISLSKNADGYYCEQCKRVIAVFEEW